MKNRTLFYNGRVLTQADGLSVDSIAVSGNRIVAIGNGLQHDSDWRAYSRIDLRGRTMVPGLVDAHTHFHWFARTLAQVSLDGVDSLEKCLKRIKTFADALPRGQWLVGTGLFPDGFVRYQLPDRLMLDRVTGRRPAFIFFKDTHSAWVNSKALEFGGITLATPDPEGGRIERFSDGTPSGILRENHAYQNLFRSIPPLSPRAMDKYFAQALQLAYRRGVTGVHSFDGPDGFTYLADLAERGKLGLRIEYYPPAVMLPQLEKTHTRYGTGTDFFRIAGVKLFADGALGSQTALCFRKYVGSKRNVGIEVTPVAELTKAIRRAARLGLPSAVHAIGDRGVSNVLDAFESVGEIRAKKNRYPTSCCGEDGKRRDWYPTACCGEGGRLRHRIEHLQLVRPKDLTRVKRLGIVASMQPSHCTADVEMVRKYWSDRSANAYVFRSVLDKGISLAFGSDAPIEALDPIAGIAAAVRRARPGSRDIFHPEQRIYATEALRAYTVGPAYAAGQEYRRGFLLPGYPADLVVLDRDITRIAPLRIGDTEVLATILDGRVRYCHSSLNW